MASVAQKLITTSLRKLAQNTNNENLHKYVLVTSVLQKARYVAEQEAYNMFYQIEEPVNQPGPEAMDIVDPTAEEAGLEQALVQDKSSNSLCLKRRRAVDEMETEEAVEPSLPKRSRQDDAASEVSLEDLSFLDDVILPLEAVSIQDENNSLQQGLAVANWETEEAVHSMSPKSSKFEDEAMEVSIDHLFLPTQDIASPCEVTVEDLFLLDEASLLSEAVSQEIEAAIELARYSNSRTSLPSCSRGSSEEIDHVTSLVSLLNINMSDESQLNRPMSTSDECSVSTNDCMKLIM